MIKRLETHSGIERQNKYKNLGAPIRRRKAAAYVNSARFRCHDRVDTVVIRFHLDGSTVPGFPVYGFTFPFEDQLSYLVPFGLV
nr:hypothetical protein X990_3273 [Burkholderia pseudomallei MSHR4868]